MPTLCKVLTNGIPEIVARWEKSVDRDPWSQLSRTDRLDELPEFLQHLFDATVCSGPTLGDPQPMLDTAARHGEQRRRVGLNYDHVMEESAVLRRAVWELAHSHRDEHHGMLRVDSALTVALMASLRGYAKPEVEARGEWDSTLARLVADWSLLLRN